MTILEIIEQQPNKKDIYKFLCDLFWQRNLTNLDLLELFLQQKVAIELDDYSKYWLIDWVKDYFDTEYIKISKLLLKDMIDEEMHYGQNIFHLLLESEKPRKLFKRLYEERIKKYWIF